MDQPSEDDGQAAMDDPPRLSTGNHGLDHILGGGLDANRLYLLEGRPGTGKTTLALQFLLEGVRGGERTLYVSLSETERELRLVARRHGWSLDGISLFELVPAEAALDRERDQSVFHPSEMELGETTRMIFDRVTALNPTRVVFDSLSELRLSRRARCATAGRSSPSSTSSPIAAARSSP
jgi:circadian clock protein KaiC